MRGSRYTAHYLGIAHRLSDSNNELVVDFLVWLVTSVCRRPARPCPQTSAPRFSSMECRGLRTCLVKSSWPDVCFSFTSGLRVFHQGHNVFPQSLLFLLLPKEKKKGIGERIMSEDLFPSTTQKRNNCWWCSWNMSSW